MRQKERCARKRPRNTVSELARVTFEGVGGGKPEVGEQYSTKGKRFAVICGVREKQRFCLVAIFGTARERDDFCHRRGWEYDEEKQA